MSKLERLIQQYCPDGVEYLRLDSVCSVMRGKRLTKSQLTSDGKYKVFHGGIEPIGFFDEWNREGNTTMVINVGASAGTIGYSSEKFWSSDGCFCLSQSDLISGKFLFYYFQTIEHYLISKVRRAGIPTLDGKILEDLEIPIPPLPVQEEIVRVLDAFTELQAELQAELQKRKQQYNFYRDNLLNFKDINRGGQEIKWMKMSEIGNNLDRKRKPITAGKRVPGQIPYYGASGLVDYVKDHLFDGDYLLVSEDGANLLTRTYPIAFSIHGKTWVNNHAHVIEFKERATRKYVEYYLNSIDLSPWISAGAQPKLTQDSLNKLTIPVPPLAEQQRIVSILDRFDTLTNDLTSGLPAEMEKRRQQYEYYRDKLLTFKRKGA